MGKDNIPFEKIKTVKNPSRYYANTNVPTLCKFRQGEKRQLDIDLRKLGIVGDGVLKKKAKLNL